MVLSVSRPEHLQKIKALNNTDQTVETNPCKWYKAIPLHSFRCYVLCLLGRDITGNTTASLFKNFLVGEFRYWSKDTNPFFFKRSFQDFKFFQKQIPFESILQKTSFPKTWHYNLCYHVSKRTGPFCLVSIIYRSKLSTGKNGITQRKRRRRTLICAVRAGIRHPSWILG